MPIVTPAVEDYPSLVALEAARLPFLPQPELDFPVMVPVFQPDVVVRAWVDEHGSVLGWGWIAALDVLPPGWALLHVVVGAEHEGQGVGGAVHRALLEAVPAGATILRSAVCEEDPRTHAITAHWGYELVQRSIASRLALDAVVRPVLPAGITLEPGLDVPDPDAVDRMLRASQTNPEAAEHVTELAEAQNSLAKIPNPLALVARVDGVPAGIVYGGVPDGTLLILYAGVDPRLPRPWHREAPQAAGPRRRRRPRRDPGGHPERGAQHRHPPDQRGARLRAALRRAPPPARALMKRPGSDGASGHLISTRAVAPCWVV